MLRGTAGAVAFTFVPSHVLGRAGAQSANEKLNIAAIGIGGMAASNINACSSENIVALCDVDDAYAAKVFNKFPNARKYKDFRVMLDKEDKNIDAVIVATPDHTHAVAAMACIRRNKHIYCQKPLAHSIYEVRKLTEAAREHKVQTQMGNQGHSSEEIRMLYEWIADGAIGPVHEVYAWSDRPVGGDPWSDFPIMARPKETPEVPKTLDWDLWLGPVQYRPYHPIYCPMQWRGWWDFGTGALGDMGTIMHGSHGAGGVRIVPGATMKAYKRPEKTIPRVPRGSAGHEQDWVRACKDGKPASSTFDYGGPLTEMVLLGVLAMRLKDTPLEWDPVNLKITNHDEANKYVNPPYRQGWSL